MKAYTDLKQSHKLAEILPLESADMHYFVADSLEKQEINYAIRCGTPIVKTDTPCWSLTALLKYLSEIKPQVYTPILFPSEGKWILQFVEHGHGNVCSVSCDNPIDACCEIILKLKERHLI